MPTRRPTRHKDDTFTVHALGMRIDAETMRKLSRELDRFSPVTYTEFETFNAQMRARRQEEDAHRRALRNADLTVRKFETAKRKRERGHDIPLPTDEEKRAYAAAKRVLRSESTAQDRRDAYQREANDRARARG